MNSSAWFVVENADLQARNSLRVAARARRFLRIKQTHTLPEALAAVRPKSLLMLGEGSNVLLADDPPDTVVCLEESVIQVIAQHDAYVLIRATAGVAWHELVMWSLRQGLCGLENLALIPGTVGAAPVQNIGAYGVQLAQFVHAVEAWDTQTNQWCYLDGALCQFSYRNSLFKQHPNRYLITAVALRLYRQAALHLSYPGINAELKLRGIEQPTAMDVARAVIAIRQRKLPNPKVLGNAGSFFKNPQILQEHADQLSQHYPQLPVFAADDPAYCKLSAAWLIEACGWKGARAGDAGIAPTHALVLVNHGQASGAELLAFARQVADSVYERFAVHLQPEPHIIGAHW